MTIPGWTDGGLNLAYDGEDRGIVVVKGPHTDLTLPATSSIQHANIDGEDMAVTMIHGSGETKAGVPDLAGVEACVSAKVPPDLKNDASAYLVFALSCVGTVPAGRAPVAVDAYVEIGILPGDAPGTKDVSVMVKRTYLDKTSAPDGKLTIAMFPKTCNLVDQ